MDIRAVARRRVSVLEKTSMGCDESLRETIKTNSKLVGEHELWGQFLEDDSHQVGIYGTSAALCIMATDVQLRPRCIESLKTLPGVASDRGGSRGHDAEAHGTTSPQHGDSAGNLAKSDLDLTLKCVAVLDATLAVTQSLDLAQEVIEVIKSGFLPDRGWGYETTVHCTIAEIIPTARVLISTAVLEKAVFGNERTAAVLWLSAEIVERSRLRALDLAFALAAFRANLEYAEENFNIASRSKVVDAVAVASNKLREWCKGRPPILVEYYEHIHYLSHDTEQPMPNGRLALQGRYMFYPVDAVVALAVISNDLPRALHRYVRRVVDAVCLNIEKHNAYRSAATGRMATADAQLCYALLERFRTEAGSQGAFKSSGLYFDKMGRTSQMGLLLGLGLMALLGVWVGLEAPVPAGTAGGITLAVHILGVVAGTVSGSILARFLSRLIFKI